MVADALHESSNAIVFSDAVPYVSSGIITSVVPAVFHGRGQDEEIVIGITPSLAAAAFAPHADIAQTGVRSVRVGNTLDLSVLRVSNSEIVVAASRPGTIGAPGSTTELVVELESGVLLTVDPAACRCAGATVAGVRWPGVIGCGALSTVACKGEGVAAGSVASKVCLGSGQLASSANTTACTNSLLKSLSHAPMREDTARDVMEEFVNYTRNTPLFAPEDVRSSFNIFVNVTALLGRPNMTRKVGSLVLRGASDMLGVDGSVLTSAARDLGVSVASIPSIVEKWGDAFVDDLQGDRATVQVQDNLVLLALRFSAGRDLFTGSANYVNAQCTECGIDEVAADSSGGGMGAVVTSHNIPFTISSTDVRGAVVTLFRDSRLFAGGAVLNSITNTTVDQRLLQNNSFVDSPVLSIQARRDVPNELGGTVRFKAMAMFTC